MLSGERSLVRIAETLEHAAFEFNGILASACRNFPINGNTNHAGAIAFYSLLSIMPLSLLTVLVAGFFLGDSRGFYGELVWWIGHYYPEVSIKLFSRVVERIAQNAHIVGWLALITSIWFSSFVFGAIETSFNAIFRSRTIRGYFFSKMFATAMIPLCWLIAVSLMFANIFMDMLLKNTPFLKSFPLYPLAQEWVFPVLLPFAVGCGFCTIIYKVVPTNRISWAGAAGGSVVFCILVGAAKMCFSWYVVNFGSYDIIFGSLEKMMILLVWMFYVAFIFLFSAELIAAYERRDLILLEKTLLGNGDSAILAKMLFRRFGVFYEQGRQIFAEGEKGTDLFYILAGEVTLFRGTKEGEREVLQVLQPGKFFGEMAAITGRARNASACASHNSHIAQIDAHTLRHLFRTNEDFAFGFMRELANKWEQHPEENSAPVR